MLPEPVEGTVTASRVLGNLTGRKQDRTMGEPERTQMAGCVS